MSRPFDLLTDREREVLRLVVQGLLNKQIAAALRIHERTVKLHRTNLITKLRVRSVAKLIHKRLSARHLPLGRSISPGQQASAF